MSEYTYQRYNNEPLRHTGYEALNVAAYKQQANAQAGADQQVKQPPDASQPVGQYPGGIIGPASSLPELWTASYLLSGLMIRDVTAKKAREIAAHELALRLANALEDKIEANMRVHPTPYNVDAVRYEVQFLIHTRKEFEQTVRAEAKKLLETALS